MDSKSRIYNLRGVSSLKEDVAAAVSGISSGIFPGAFCKAIANPFPQLSTNSVKEPLFLSHADGTGSKSVMAYLYWQETSDLSVFRGLSQDAIVMNTDDLLCVGAVDHFYFSSTIARNKNRIPSEVLSALLEGTEAYLSQMREWGIHCELMGGETADLGDVVKTLTVDMNAVTFMDKSKFIDTAKIKPGLAILGLASSGKTKYEIEYNSGIASNGLTSARHDLLIADYCSRYPETYDESILKELVYSGRYRVQDPLKNTSIDIGQALLSPTRSYLPVVKAMLEEYPESIMAMIHLTGGGQTKCLKFGKGIHFVKDNLFELPPLFQIIAANPFYQEAPEELYKVFNCGHRLELYVEERWVDSLIKIADAFSLSAQVVGYTESLKVKSEENESLNNSLALTIGNQQHYFYS